MIFIPCKDGISHNEIEDAKPEHVAAGCNVLLRAMLERAGQPSNGITESTEAATENRILRLSAPAGRLNITYECTVDILHHRADPAKVAELPLANIPDEVLPYLYPSRYCQSDALGATAVALFGQLPRGYLRVQAIRDWVHQHVAFKPNSSHSGTSALDTLRDRQGVCRDFAHLMIALCRALNIPARFTTGTDYGADPALGPPDFHAYVEVYLDSRWYIFDPSGTAIPMGFIRIGTGRDASDVSFATIFGGFHAPPPVIHIRADSTENGFEAPSHQPLAFSTAV